MVKPGARIAWLGGHKQILGGHKNYNTSNSGVRTKKNKGLHREIPRILDNDQKKKDLDLEICADFHKFRDEEQKKKQ